MTADVGDVEQVRALLPPCSGPAQDAQTVPIGLMPLTAVAAGGHEAVVARCAPMLRYHV